MGSATEENKALVRRLGQVINARQFELLDQLVAADFVRHCQATPEVDVRSLEQFKDYLRQDAAAFPDFRQTLKHLIGEGNLVAIWATYEGTQRGQLGPFPPSGRKMQLDFAAVFRVENGKVMEMWVTWDNLAVLAQLGHFPVTPHKKI